MFMLRSALERRGLSREDAHRRVVQLAEEAVRGFQDYTRSWAEMESVRRRLLAELEKLEK
jgi:molecular chaperone GrpE (heat shock protein)